MQGHFVEVNGLRLHYLEVGQGLPVLFLHGWPTHAQLWRHVLPDVAKTRRAIALDLPGFGRSDKPTDVLYTFSFFDRILDGFRERLEIERLGLAVHDLGGPVGLHWAVQHPERIVDLALLNTLVFPELSWAVKLFVLATYVPGVRGYMTSASGLAAAMRFGVEDKAHIPPDVARIYQEPFREASARQALLKTAQGTSPNGFRRIAAGLARLTMPVRIVYGESDRILPDVASTMERVREQLPQAELTALPGVGHFLQEDAPEPVARLLAEFFARQAPS